MAPNGKELSDDLKKIIIALLKDGLGYKKITKTLKLSCSQDTSATFIFSSSVLLLCVHTQYNQFAHPSHPSCLYYYLLSPIYCFCTSYLSCTSCFALFFILLHILLFISFFYLYICSCLVLLLYKFYSLHCPLSGPDLIYISLLIIPCIIYHVTNKETLNLEPCSTVAKTIQRFNRTGSTQNRPRHGRPKKLSTRAQRHIQRLCLGNIRILRGGGGGGGGSAQGLAD